MTDDTTPAEAITATHKAAALADATDAAESWARSHRVMLSRQTLAALVSAAAPHIAARATADERQRLAAPLADAIEGLHEMIGYVPDYFRDKWDHQGYIDRAEQALADLLAAQDTEEDDHATATT